MDYFDINLVKDNTTIKSGKRTIQVLLAIIIVMAILVSVVRILGFGKVYHYDLKDEIVTRIISNNTNGQNEEKDYKDSSIPATKTGDKIIFEIRIPERLFDGAGALCFYQYHSEIKVKFENQVIYTYGQDLTKNHKMYGNELCIVEIPDEVWGKQITIEVTQMETSSSNHSTNFRILHLKDARMYPIISNAILYMLYIIIAIIALIILVASVVSRVFREKIDFDAMSIAIFSLFLCLWQMGSRRYMYILSNNRSIASKIEFFALYAAAIPFLAYLIRVHKKTIYKKIYIAMELVYTTFFAVCIVSHAIFHYHIVNFETAFYVLIFIALSTTLVIELIASKDDHRSKTVDVKNGLLCSTGLCAIQVMIIVFREVFHRPIPKFFLSVDFATIAVLVFVLTMFSSISKSFLNSFAIMHEQKSNEHLAYFDFLTMIPNRLYCSKILEKYDSEKDGSYGVVFLDLDYLKYGNDKFGHKMGDKMLQTAANCIKECFTGSGSFGRWGGDEFIAVFDNPEDIDGFIERFHAKIKKINDNKKFPFDYHVSLGVCIKQAGDDMDANVVIANADQAMYQDKKSYKSNHQIR